MGEVVHTAELTPESIRKYAGAKIVLTQNQFAIVSPEDFARINARKWFFHYGVQKRAARCALRQMIYMHHEVLNVTGAELRAQFKEVDHIDGDTLNNCRENLRIVTHSENMQNTQRHKFPKGYAYHRQSGSWIAYVSYPFSTQVSLGYYKTEKEAADVAKLGQQIKQGCRTAGEFRRVWAVSKGII